MTKTAAHKFNVFPIKEIELHQCGEDCWCIPRIEECVNGNVIYHNSSSEFDITKQEDDESR